MISDFQSQPDPISFAKEGAIFQFNFNTNAKPVCVVFAVNDVFWNDDFTIVVDGKSVKLTPSSASDLDAKIKSSLILNSVVALSYNDTSLTFTAKNLEVRKITVYNWKYSFSSELNSSPSAEVAIKINDRLTSSLFVAEKAPGVYSANVAGLIPSIFPPFSTRTEVISGYPYKYQIVPSLSGAQPSNECYSFGVARPSGYRKVLKFENPLNNLTDIVAIAGQKVRIHQLCLEEGSYSIKQVLTGSDGTISTSTLPAVVAAAMQTVSFVVTMPSLECSVELFVLKNNITLGSPVTFYVMPSVERLRYLHIRNLFGLYETVPFLTPASYSFEFESEQMLLSSGGVGVKNSNIEEHYEVTIDMLTVNNARILSAMFGVHGSFIFEDAVGERHNCVLMSKSLDSASEDECMQSVKLKFQVV